MALERLGHFLPAALVRDEGGGRALGGQGLRQLLVHLRLLPLRIPRHGRLRA